VSGAWNTNGGTLNSTAVGPSDIVRPFCAGADQIYSARLLNEFGSSGNRVGLIYDYQAGDYYEVVFSPTGIMQVNKFFHRGRALHRGRHMAMSIATTIACSNAAASVATAAMAVPD
jgi:hypothetical protein